MIVIFVKVELHKVWLLILAITSVAINLTDANVTDHTPHKRHKLYLLSVSPHHEEHLAQKGWNGGPGLVPAARLAVQQINNSTDILPNHELSLIEVNSVCYDSSVAMATLLNAYVENILYSGDNIVGIVGPACSVNTVLIGELSQPNRTPLVQVTTASSPRFESRILFPYTFATLSSGRQFSRALLELFRQQEWKTVGVVLNGNSLYFKDIYSFLLQGARGSKTEIKTLSTTSDINSFSLEQIIHMRVRVIIVLSGRKFADELLCRAYKNEPRMTYPTVQWLFVERSSILNPDITVPCSKQELAASFKKAVFLQYQLETTDKVHPLVSGQNYVDFQQDYMKEVENYEQEFHVPINIQEDFGHGIEYAPVFYDAVWAFGLSLDRLVRLGSPDDLDRLSNHRPIGSEENLQVAEAISRHMFEMDPFKGASGTVDFDNTTGQTSTLIRFVQEEDGKQIEIGYSSRHINGSFLEDNFDIQFDGINQWVVSLNLLGVILLLVISIFFHGMNIRYSNYKHIKASSPRLNHLIFIGSYLVLIGMTTFTVSGGFYVTNWDLGKLLCSFYVWFVDVGVTLIAATVFIKTFRIHRIFVHFKNPGGLILHDSSLCVCILGLVLPVVLSCIASNSIGLIKWYSWEDGYMISLNNTLSIHTRTTCNIPWWQEIFPKIYVGILLFISLMLSVPIRRINPQYKTIKSISVLTFVQTMLTWVGYPLYFIASSKRWNQHISYLVITVMLTGIMLTCLLLIFVPPILPELRRRWRSDKTADTIHIATSIVVCTKQV